MDNTAKVVTQNFAEKFVDLLFFRFAFQSFAELSFIIEKTVSTFERL